MKCKYTKKFYEFVKSENYKVIKAKYAPFDKFQEILSIVIVTFITMK